MRRGSRHVGRGLMGGLMGLVGLAWAGRAGASDAYPLYVVPTAVEQSPGAPVTVVIHGAFFRLQSTTTFLYGDPQCGVMHFQCAAGDETLCRLQWDNLAAHIPTSAAPTKACAGFGSLYVLSTATLRPEGTPLGTPDPWDLGMGIGDGAYVDNKCPPAQKLVCPRVVGGSGGANGGGGGGTPGSGGASGGGTGGMPGAASGGMTGSGGGAVVDAAASSDATSDARPAVAPDPAARGKGCAVGADGRGAGARTWTSFAAVALLVVSVRRRRRRR